jgi:beta-lactam-binding protein with PASTA domain
MAAAPRERLDASADEITLSDDTWPVSELYRVPPLEAESGDGEDLGARPAPAAPPPRFRRQALRDRRTALLALAGLVAILLGAGASWFLTGADDPADASPPARQATDEGAAAAGTGKTGSPAAPVGATRTVPALAGVSVAEARDVLDEAGLRARVRLTQSDEPSGVVIGLRPAPGSEVQERALVTLLVATGAPRVAVPDVVGGGASAARRMLEEAGLRARIVRVASSKSAGTVIGQEPAAGAEVDRRSSVVLRVAKPIPVATVDLPQLTGLTVSAAQARLRELGLRSRVTRADSQEQEGMVVEQSPRAGAALERGAVVTLTVSAGPATIAVPDVVGLEEGTARSQLEAAGFEVATVDEATSDPMNDGVVLGQSPSAGTQGKPGTLVTLRVARSS